ncbi:MAG TPA: sugar phosphate nucleotidyltransferase [Opitutaceae bacterium]|nr:sugar phosphate nucleotidyltransferase [Opitutaceae bacterium]
MPQKFIVILAGGKGERFWPQSRRRTPKHLLPIVGADPMLVQTLARVRPLVPAANIFIITAAEQAEAVRAACPRLPRANIVAEPVGRDTAPAVALAAALVAQRDSRGIFAVLPADHVIHDRRAYQADLRAAFAAAGTGEVMITIGIKPHEPATGFGYIQRGERWRTFARRPFFTVRRFVEKPSLEVARGYLAAGDYLWNAGMFVWSVPVVLKALEQHAPDLRAGLDGVMHGLARRRALAPLLKKIYPRLPKISVDYALLEKAGNVVVLPASFDWDDVGSWPAIARHHEADPGGNVLRGRAIVEDGRNNIVVSSDGHLLGVIGADDLIVVHTPDATLVCPRQRAQDIKRLLKRIESERDAHRWL